MSAVLKSTLPSRVGVTAAGLATIYAIMSWEKPAPYSSLCNIMSYLFIIAACLPGVKLACELYSYWFRARFIHEDSGRRMIGLFPSFPDLTFDNPLSETRRALHNRYSTYKDKTPFFVWNVVSPIVVLSEPKSVMDFFATQRSHRRNFGSFLGWGFDAQLGHMLGAAHLDTYKRMRKVFISHYTDARVANDWDIVYQTVIEFFRENVPAGSRGVHGRPCHELALREATFEMLPLTILSRIAFGADVSSKRLSFIFDMYSRHKQFLNPSMRSLRARMLPGFGRAGLTSEDAAVRALVDRWEAFCQELYNEYASNGFADKDRSDLFYNVCRKLYQKQIDLKWPEIVHTIYEVILFNVDITISEMSSLLYRLSMHPEWQDRIRSSLKPLTHQDQQVPDWSAIKVLPDLDAFISESARVHPAVKVSFPEILTESQVIGGYHLPAGTQVCVDAVALNHGDSNWAHAKTFDPDRWLNPAKDGRQSSSTNTSKSGDGIDGCPGTGTQGICHRFGLGTRHCMGFRYAQSMLKALVTHCVTSYSVSVAGQTNHTRANLGEALHDAEPITMITAIHAEVVRLEELG